MTKDEGLRKAIDAMTISLPRLAPYGEKDWLDSKAAIKACEEALTQPGPPPPKFQTKSEEDAFAFGWWKAMETKRAWVDLTDEEISEAYDDALKSFRRHQMRIRGQQITQLDDPNWHFARAIEAKLRSKNT